MNAPNHITDAAQARIRESMADIHDSLAVIAAGRPGDAERDASRRAAVLQRRRGVAYDDAVRLAPTSGAEKVWGKTIDFVDYVFLERGTRAGRAVARVATPDGQASAPGSWSRRGCS